MKVNGPGGTASVGSGGVRRPVAGGFSLEGAAAAPEAASSGAAAGVAAATLDALIAIQAAPTALERRRRAVGRAGRLLDMLDDVKLSMLEDGNPGLALDRLRIAIREQRDGTDDPRLEGILDEIETRAAVELAKREARRGLV